jgi:hypothetical protein
MKRALTLLAATLLACSSPTRVPFAANGEADLVAVLELDDEGRVVAATGLAPLSRERGLSVFTGGARHVAVGWRRAELGAAVPTDERLAATRLEAAVGCVDHLPTPAIAGDLASGAAVDAATLPVLTAAWLVDTCPEVQVDALSFDLECKQFRCPTSITPRTRCTFDVELDCTFGRVTATVHHDRTVCLEAAEPLTCAALPTEAPAAATYGCTEPEACKLHAYLGPEVPALDVDTVDLLDVAPYHARPDFIGDLALTPQRSRWIGWALDFAVSDDRVAVSLPGAAVDGCLANAPELGATLEVYDANTLEPVTRAPAPRCLVRLVPDGVGGFVGLELSRFEYRLVRFDRDGVMGVGTPADPPDGASPGGLFSTDSQATVLDVFGSPPRLVLTVVSGNPASTRLWIYDLETLAPLSRTVLANTLITGASAVDARAIVLADATESRVLWVELATGAVRTSIPIPREADRYDNFASDATWAGGRAWLTVSRKNAALYGLDEARGPVSRAAVFDSDTRPIATHPWPSDATRALVVATTPSDLDDWPTSLLTFDTVRGRFLPGHVDLGHGPPGRITTDARGRTWVLLPWAPRLVRATPR